MRQLALLAATAIGVVALPPVTAQTSTPTPEHEAISAGTAPTTAAANSEVGAAANAHQAATDAANMDAQAQYAQDVAAYDAAVRAQHAQTMADEAHWRHQQRAYADAMAAWRAQVAACKAGHTRACNAPSPEPAAYW